MKTCSQMLTPSTEMSDLSAVTRVASMAAKSKKVALILVVLSSVVAASATARPLICGYICDSFGKCYRVCS